MDRLEGATIISAGIRTSEEEMAVKLSPTATQSLKERIEARVGAQGDDSAWQQARVRAAEIQVPGASAVASIDCHRSVAGSSVSVPLRTLVLLVARFVAFLSEPEMTAPRDRLDGEGAEAEPLDATGDEGH